ncbi:MULTISPECIES: threonine/serine dehydratase [Actinosynnema]|uniref:threonine ammonia-lyase n=1 Tax=Actinosynnema TaxID=40566 RepID=UPI0020A564B7|nr:pyridoxal-phosphate dependent enzyme [Actinosynnema pretiosum]MCP2097566.1 L-threonine ammonia-lyase [Actinosynnema pretiosum]
MTLASVGYLTRHRAAIDAARLRVADHVRRTPLRALDGGTLLKLESTQVAGSFKMRGACNALLSLPDGVPGVVATSSGNHARAVATAARIAGLRVTVVIPQDAVPAKVDAIRALGAEVVDEGVTFGNRDGLARALAAERGWPFVHSSDDWDVIHGQATVAEEVVEDHPGVTAVVVPVGGGGLLAGTALAVRSRLPGVAVIGVEPERAADAAASLRTGRLHRLAATPDTVADGARVVSLGERTFEVIVERGLVDGIVTVSEAEILAAWEALGDVPAEPTGALPLAAVLAGRVPGGPGTVLVVSGGNVPRRAGGEA